MRTLEKLFAEKLLKIKRLNYNRQTLYMGFRMEISLLL